MSGRNEKRLTNAGCLQDNDNLNAQFNLPLSGCLRCPYIQTNITVEKQLGWPQWSVWIQLEMAGYRVTRKSLQVTQLATAAGIKVLVSSALWGGFKAFRQHHDWNFTWMFTLANNLSLRTLVVWASKVTTSASCCLVRDSSNMLSALRANFLYDYQLFQSSHMFL